MNFREWLNEHTIAHNPDGKYWYRVHPKGDIENVLRKGLYSVTSGESPGSYVDAPEMERWPDQDIDDPQSSRLYFANRKWKINADRFRIRVPRHYVEDQIQGKDNLGDYYVDTGADKDLVLTTKQFDIEIGGRWMRADTVDPIMLNTWKAAYYKPRGYYGNKWHQE